MAWTTLSVLDWTTQRFNEAGIAVFAIGQTARTLEGIYRDVSGGAAEREGA